MKTYFYRLFLLCTIVFLGVGFDSYAEVRAYRYSHSVTDDGVKTKSPFVKLGLVFYFAFSNDDSKCYIVDQTGIWGARGDKQYFVYIGTSNGMHIYRKANPVGYDEILYFSLDYKRLNHRCGFDFYLQGSVPSTRVLNYISDPNAIDVPDKLY